VFGPALRFSVVISQLEPLLTLVSSSALVSSMPLIGMIPWRSLADIGFILPTPEVVGRLVSTICKSLFRDTNIPWDYPRASLVFPTATPHPLMSRALLFQERECLIPEYLKIEWAMMISRLESGFLLSNGNCWTAWCVLSRIPESFSRDKLWRWNPLEPPSV
jgi:hypothetical protein